MEPERFDFLTSQFVSKVSRRRFGRLAALLGLGASLPRVTDAVAKKKKGKRKKKLRRCTPVCAGRRCGDDGCGGSCGACDGGSCPDGKCVCPTGGYLCGRNRCCPNGQPCEVASGVCGQCRLGDSPTGPRLCGLTGTGKPCACATSIDGATACVPGPNFHCSACASDADCEETLGLPGGAVCLDEAGDFCPQTGGKACLVSTCVDVTYCDPGACTTGTCIDHRCQ